MDCITIDDNLAALAAMKQLVERVDILHLNKEFDNAIDAVNYVSSTKVDLLFLDIEMPDINGLELIDGLENPPLIIVVSAKKDYALEAFEKHVVDYLVKPVSFSRFLSAVNFAQKIYESRWLKKESDKALFIKADGRWNKVIIEEITHLQAMGDYVRVFSAQGKLMVSKTMKSMLKSLPERKFVRVHRSFIINIDHIDNIEDHSIAVGNQIIPISESLKNDLMEKLNLL